MIRTLILLCALFPMFAAANILGQAQFSDQGLPAWVNDVGAKHEPTSRRLFSANQYGANGNGSNNSTRAIQRAIDACTKAGGGIVTFQPGRYLTGALFLKNNVHLQVPASVMLLGSQDEADYPAVFTRVAGIEMKWPAALINVNEQRNVKISGDGVIDGQGEKWWEKYWNLRRDYDSRGLRWASDYDAQRVRIMVVWKSEDVTIKDLKLMRSGFWTVQVVYSSHVTVDGIKITDNKGPSTDGVDIDSSSHVLVKNCDIDCNDDDICLKAGRDSDGLRVNRPTEYVVIRNNITRRGNGVLSFGSETSGGIRKIVAIHNRGIGTNEGVRFKSARTRGGYVEDVLIRDLRLERVPLPFSFTLNWNPSYSYAIIPGDATDIPAYWKILSTPVTPPERGLCEFRNITIEDVKADGARRIFSAAGLPERPIINVVWENITARALEAGVITNARNWTMRNVELLTTDGKPVTLTDCVQVEAPKVIESKGAR